MIKAAMEQGCFGPVMPVHHFPLPAVFHLMAETFKGWPLARGLRRNRTPQIFFPEHILDLAHHTVNGKYIGMLWVMAAGNQRIVCPPVVQRDGFCMVDK